MEIMTFKNCDLFKRSFTNKGIGYSYNNAKANDLFKQNQDLQNLFKIFFVNEDQDPVKMKSASKKHALVVLVENNDEEVQRFEDIHEYQLKPTEIEVALHNPFQPANFRSESFEIFLGHTSTVYITPTAREIDESGKKLTEEQRNCRLTKDVKDLKIFNYYTKEACIYECKLGIALKKCGCLPWSYPSNLLV